MNTYTIAIYCEVKQQGVDANDAVNRLCLNLNNSSTYHEDEGVEVLRQREGCPDPVYPTQIRKMTFLRVLPVEASPATS